MDFKVKDLKVFWVGLKSKVIRAQSYTQFGKFFLKNQKILCHFSKINIFSLLQIWGISKKE